jgi:hypothetical protein
MGTRSTCRSCLRCRHWGCCGGCCRSGPTPKDSVSSIWRIFDQEAPASCDDEPSTPHDPPSPVAHRPTGPRHLSRPLRHGMTTTTPQTTASGATRCTWAGWCLPMGHRGARAARQGVRVWTGGRGRQMGIQHFLRVGVAPRRGKAASHVPECERLGHTGQC